MTEPHPLMALLLEHNSFLGGAEVVEEKIQPLDEQLNFDVGDTAILATANTPLERDFVVLKMVDAEKYKKVFPDWEERMLGTESNGWSSFVLCKYFSRSDNEEKVGWFSRLKLLPISTYRYREARRWLKNGFPSEVPDWAVEVYQNYTDKLSVNAPTVVPRSVTCPNCGDRNVTLKIIRHLTYSARAGVLTIDEKEQYVPLNDPDEESAHTALLVCGKCPTEATLSDEEWMLPGISN